MYKYNKKIIEIIEDVKNQKEEVDKRKNLIEHYKENEKTTRKKTTRKKTTRKKTTRKKIEEEKKKM